MIAILRRGLVVGGAGGGEPCLHMLAYVHGRDPHCKLPPRTAEGARWKVGCTEGEEASVGVVGVQHAEKLEGRTPTHVKSELGCHSHRFLRRPRQSSSPLVYALPPHTLLLSAVHRRVPYTLTQHGSRPCAPPAPLEAASSHQPDVHRSQQRVRRAATHIRRCWCRRGADHTRGACTGSLGWEGSVERGAIVVVRRRETAH